MIILFRFEVPLRVMQRERNSGSISCGIVTRSALKDDATQCHTTKAVLQKILAQFNFLMDFQSHGNTSHFLKKTFIYIKTNPNEEHGHMTQKRWYKSCGKNIRCKTLLCENHSSRSGWIIDGKDQCKGPTALISQF